MEGHLSFIFEKNIIYWKEGKLLDGNYSDTNFVFRSNIYWNVTTTNFNFDKFTFQDWQQKKGQDAGSLIADPMFEDASKDNYKFKPGSPINKIGFTPFDYSNFGVRPIKK